LPTRWGVFRTIGFEWDAPDDPATVETAVALVMGDLAAGVPLVRLHSQCLTGEAFGSLRCDCAQQLDLAMHAIADEGTGLVVYEHQEGRGIGLMAKLRAYALQDYGFDTVDANDALGYLPDCRNFALPCAILHDLGIGCVRLLSNTPDKARALADAGIEILACLPCEGDATTDSASYLRTKKERMGHTFTHLQPEAGAPPADDPQFACIEAAIAELQAGRMIVVIDDEDRENEGDLTMAAEMITPAAVNFMATHGRGLICLAMTRERLHEL